MAEDDHRSGMDDALATAFGGNPILFLGSGIGEDDLLRPLRQFVGNYSPVGGRLSVALLPAQQSEAELELVKIRHLQRYGVYTIHYGYARVGEASETLLLIKIAAWRKAIDEALQAIEDNIANSRNQKHEVGHVKTRQEVQCVTHLKSFSVTAYRGFDLKAEFALLEVASAFCDMNSTWPDENQRVEFFSFVFISGRSPERWIPSRARSCAQG